MHKVQISSSLLSADFSRLGEEIKAVEPFVERIHLDIMDGHFVPNLTFGPAIVAKLRPWTSLPFDVHLMIAPVAPFLEAFAKAGANRITVHAESGPHVYRLLQDIKAFGCEAGVALNPGTPAEMIIPLLPIVDLMVVMTVNPGFGGQTFLESQLVKIKEVRTLLNKTKRKIFLEVDGGIGPETAPLVIEAGADIVVAGSAIFKGGRDHYQKNIQALRL